jgi:MFS family permease
MIEGMTRTARITRPRVHYAWLVLGAATLMLLASSGVRSSFGVFIKPLEAQFGWGRTSLSTVASLSLFLYGAMGPLVGRLADRWGPRGVLAVTVILVGLGAVGTSAISSLWQLYLTAGLLTAIGAGGAAMSVVASLAARWFDTRRGLVPGIAGGGMAAGQLLIVPLLMALTVTWGWRASFYGRYSVGELSGWIFFSHQIGAATAMVLAIRVRPAAGRPPERPATEPVMVTAPGA